MPPEIRAAPGETLAVRPIRALRGPTRAVPIIHVGLRTRVQPVRIRVARQTLVPQGAIPVPRPTRVGPIIRARRVTLVRPAILAPPIKIWPGPTP